MIEKINNNTDNIKYLKSQTAFKGFAPSTRFLDGFIKSQENLSTTRFIQGTATNWFPKAVFSRSKADFWEFTFLEFMESGLFYFAAPLLGEHFYRKGLFKKIQPQNLRQTIHKNLSHSIDQIEHSNLNKLTKSRLISTKAGMVIACLAVPALEYALSFAKNLLTLKVFKISDFNNVANLDKNGVNTEEKSHQQKVEKHAKYELKKAGILSSAGVLTGLLFAALGQKSKALQKFSKILLEPGAYLSKKFNVKSKKLDNFLKEYLKLDLNESDGKLSLSKGQLAATCITGLFGYSSAAKDRGKLDFYEVWTRVPIVVLYTIFGSSLFDSGFKHILDKNGKFPELIKKDKDGIINVPSRNDLPEIAKKLAQKNNTNIEKELETLIRQKSVITGVPYLFSLLVVGFTLSGVARLWTQIRYNKQHKQQEQNQWTKDNITSTAFQGIHNIKG